MPISSFPKFRKGAALVCPDRKTVALTGDGSAMYTLQ
jgi:TPP-dependent 2-oxoacid decarboxylase